MMCWKRFLHNDNVYDTPQIKGLRRVDFGAVFADCGTMMLNLLRPDNLRGWGMFISMVMILNAVLAQDAPPKAIPKAIQSKKIQAVSSNGGQPVPFAVIVNKNSGQQVMTDAAGYALITCNPATDTLLLRSVGFMDMVIYPGQPLPKSLRMVEDMVSLDQVEVVSQSVVSMESIARDNMATSINRLATPVAKLEVPQTSAELLWATGSVMVQQSQQGGGSPILRGFEANRVLLVVDGVRMNNAIYRSGHLQNAITVDPNILERTDVLLGPNSILFGSDAMGGVIHYHTRSPRLKGQGVTARISSAYRTPNQSYSLHGDVEWSGHRMASLTSFSHSTYGDLRMGSWRRHGNATWGLDSLYVVRTEGTDEVRINEEPELQVGSGYSQQDWLQKFRVQLGPGILDLNFQWSRSGDIPRYDVSGDLSGGQPKWAEWNYGPQQRTMASAQYQLLTRWDVKWTTMVSYQSIEESRIKRRLHALWRETQTENVRIWNAYSTVSKRFYNGLQVTAGINLSDDLVQSVAQTRHIETDEMQEADTRYPNSGSDMGTAAAFANARLNWMNHQFTGGMRWSQSSLGASFEPGVNYTLPFTAVSMRNSALTGGISDRWYSPSRVWSTSTSFSTGFRHPNVDDMGKVREKGGYVLIPNDSLRPEYLLSVEQALHWDFQNRQIFTATLSGFGSKLNDAIVPQNAQLQGSDWFFIDGDSARVQTHVNASRALIGGVRAEINAKLTSKWTVQAAINWTVGDQFMPNPETALEDRLPMAHIPPIFGRIAMDWQGRWWTLQASSLFSGSKSASKFGPFATDNLDLMLPEGAPNWWTLNAEFSAKLHESVECRLGIRNLLDMHYRVFASGISAPGRGVYASVHAAF